jgi:protein gp37
VADGTGIEWTDATWNVVSGCTRVSEGCERCYIERTPPFRMEGRRFDGPQIGATTGVRLHEDRLALPLKWRAPRRIFVNSLSDLFHGEVPDDLIAKVFAVMALAPRHAFQVLTKRQGRMRSLLSSDAFPAAVAYEAGRLTLVERAGRLAPRPGLDSSNVGTWPLPNVWLGVSVENQHWADARIPQLLDTPAAVRWISAEPLLGPVDLARFVGEASGLSGDWPRLIDWVVAGGESGPGARPMHPQWARDLRGQCAAAEVPFLFKQWGEWRHGGAGAVMVGAGGSLCPTRGDLLCTLATFAASNPGHLHTLMSRVGKKAAGRELDGRTWDEYPAVAG